jgi:dephospho-CoA kinase
MSNRKLVIGLTGGIGSGKSTVASLFGEFGATVVDTDAIAHELTQSSGVAVPAILATFGKAYIDSRGGLDRAAMRALAFSDPQAKRHLEEILHPLISTVADEQLAKASGPYSVLVVPLLVESGSYHNRIERILVVDCDEQTQLTRAMARSGLSEDAVRAIINSQASREERLAEANDVIDNSGDPANLRPQVDALHRHYLILAAQLAAKD